MMKRCKNIAILMIVACIIFVLSACNSQESETVRSFEYYFLREEYEEAYSKVEKMIELQDDSNYEIKITSSRESGTIAMALSYMNEDGEVKLINMTSPTTETIEIARGTTASFTFSAKIDPDTQGNVKVEVLSDNK